MPTRRAVLLGLLCPLVCGAASAQNDATIVDVRKIWDAGEHNAFTDLIRFRSRWYCVLREGQAHVSPDGAIRVLVSKDGRDWQPAARLTSSGGDLRDPKICETPRGELMLTAAAALHPPASAKHQTLVWFSRDGSEWGQPVPIGEPDFWLWRVRWHKATAYGAGYGTAGQRLTRLYSSVDGRQFNTLVLTLCDRGFPNESTLVFLPGDEALCLARRDPDSALLGRARPPYTEWIWRDLGVRVGGPNLIRLPSGRLIAAGRLYDGQTRTSICELNVASARLTELLALPSRGDSSYPGLVWHDSLLWVSYYSSHEGKTSIYLAKVRLTGNE